MKKRNGGDEHELEDLIEQTKENQIQLNNSIESLFKQIKNLDIEA
jgi:hypothetical protein